MGTVMGTMSRFVFIVLTIGLQLPSGQSSEPITLNQPADGYRGIWYFNQKSGDEYVYKYSGGLGTYCAKHKPFAIYAPAANKTFFCYGGATPANNRQLVHCVSYYDHATGMVPRPTILLDKQTDDAHDNPVISIDDEGFIWIFSTSHGRSRPSYIHKSRKPYRVDAFDRIDATYLQDDRPVPLTNFSYMQAWHVADKGFMCFFTRYGDPAKRTNMFMSSRDGVNWSSWQRLAAIEWGHYQISAVGKNKVGAAFNFHPAGKGLNWRTNLYYIESLDAGATWQTVAGSPLELPLTNAANAALIHDYRAEELNIYLKDIRYDQRDRPVILFVSSRGYASGPQNNPRTWKTARWNGNSWEIHPVTTSDNNYDTGALQLGADGTWRIIGPTDPGPQRYNPGGEMVMWLSRDQGKTWTVNKKLTSGSPMNHTYARQSVDAHPDFVAIWADGHGRQPSESRLYFCNQDGDVFMLPPEMDQPYVKPLPTRQ